MKKSLCVLSVPLPLGTAFYYFPMSTFGAVGLILFGTGCILRYRLGESFIPQIISFFQENEEASVDRSALSKHLLFAFSVMWIFAVLVEGGTFTYLKATRCPQMFFLLLLGIETLFFLKRKVKV